MGNKSSKTKGNTHNEIKEKNNFILSDSEIKIIFHCESFSKYISEPKVALKYCNDNNLLFNNDLSQTIFYRCCHFIQEVIEDDNFNIKYLYYYFSTDNTKALIELLTSCNFEKTECIAFLLVKLIILVKTITNHISIFRSDEKLIFINYIENVCKLIDSIEFDLIYKDTIKNIKLLCQKNLSLLKVEEKVEEKEDINFESIYNNLSSQLECKDISDSIEFETFILNKLGRKKDEKN